MYIGWIFDLITVQIMARQLTTQEQDDAEEAEGERQYNPILELRKYRARKPSKRDHVPTQKQREAVEECAGLGLTQGQIAKVMGISINTLLRHYKEELELGKMAKIAALSQTMFSIGTDKNHKGVVPAAMYLLKTQGGEQFREKQHTEITGKNGQAVQINTRTNTIDPSLLSGDQREALREILTSAMKLAAPASNQADDDGETIEGDYEDITDDEDDNQ